MQNLLETPEPRPKQKHRRPEPRKHTKDPPLVFFTRIFFGTMRLFFKLFGLHNRVSPSFDSIFCNTMSKNPKGSPFTFFGTVTMFKNLIFFGKFLKISQGSPSIFSIFCNQREFHKVQRVPLFTILRLRYSADFGRSQSLGWNSQSIWNTQKNVWVGNVINNWINVIDTW